MIETKDDRIIPKGMVHVELFDKDGNLKCEFDAPNQVTNAGKNSWLGIMFFGATQLPTWYIGLVDNASFTAYNVADVMSSHTGWIESVVYSGGVRPTWVTVAASGQSITNTSATVFNITSSATLQGVFIVSNSTLSGTTGTLWSCVSFPSTVAVNNGDQLKITYTVNS
jgi:hypothetical protein